MQIKKGGFAFIVGSPRSGTTVLGEILDKHEQISQWYEPYFIMDRYFREAVDDERSAADVSPKVKRQIRRDFLRYRKRMGSVWVVDKSPRNSLKVPFLRAIFPDARFIHILRDGRDAALSIHKEWLRRRSVAGDAARGDEFHYLRVAGVLKRWLDRQPFWDHKLKALWFENHGHFLDKSKNLNRLRWEGDVGWGPKFKGWEEVYDHSTLLQFNARQWLNCVERIQKHWPEIPQEKRLQIRYETLVTDLRGTVSKILDFLEMPADERFFDSLPKMKKNNYNKWATEFTDEQLDELKPVLTGELHALGYAEDDAWAISESN